MTPALGRGLGRLGGISVELRPSYPATETLVL
jgi:hypothetical protein